MTTPLSQQPAFIGPRRPAQIFLAVQTSYKLLLNDEDTIDTIISVDADQDARPRDAAIILFRAEIQAIGRFNRVEFLRAPTEASRGRKRYFKATFEPARISRRPKLVGEVAALFEPMVDAVYDWVHGESPIGSCFVHAGLASDREAAHRVLLAAHQDATRRDPVSEDQATAPSSSALLLPTHAEMAAALAG